jgi:tetratricopeptide (TPR) repeat protein
MSRSKRRTSSPAATPPVVAKSSVPSPALEWLPIGLLVAVTLVTFYPVLSCDFVDYDDPNYVSENLSVQAGWTVAGFRWAWTTFQEGNWHPLTWLSLMADTQLFGTRPWGYHLINLLLHLANTLILFVLLKRLTRMVWRSALVAAMFAVHPLHVESVAWISERKDVLSAFFGLLAMLAYARYARKPSLASYLAVFVGMALSLLAKPMLVTLPFLFLLLDYWPLERWRPADGKAVPWSRMVLEKVPFLILSVASCVVTVLAQHSGGALKSLTQITLPERLGNALLSYVQYLRQMLVPVDLAAFYPRSEGQGAMVVGAGVLLALLTGLVLRWGRRYPYLTVGWLWYLGTLVPVIGLVQVGLQARADRYTYLPLVGIFLLAVWGLADLAARWHIERLAAIGAMAILIVWIMFASLQIYFWNNAIILWEHALQVTPSNVIAHSNLAYQYQAQRKLDQAIFHYREALRCSPSDPQPAFNLGNVLLQQGDVTRAIRFFEQSLRLDPDLAATHNLLCVALLRAGRPDDALREGRQAVLLAPDSASVHSDLGNVLLSRGEIAEAIQHYQHACRLDPNNPMFPYNLGNAFLRQDDLPAAIASYRDAVRIDPEYAPAHNNLATVLLSQGDTEAAIQEFHQLLRLSPDNISGLANLGLAHSMREEWPEAVSSFLRASSLSPQTVEYHCGLALALHQQGRTEESRREYQIASRLNPSWPQSFLKLAWILATHRQAQFRNGVRAYQTVQQVVQAGGEKPLVLDVLAAACAERGQFQQAASIARRAKEKALAAGQKDLANQIEERLRLYEKGQPFRTAQPEARPFDTP